MRRLMLIPVLMLLVSAAAYGQGSIADIDRVNIYPYAFNDDQGSTFTATDNFPNRILFEDMCLNGDGTDPDFANRHVWRFRGASLGADFAFGNTTYFDLSASVRVMGDPVAGKNHEAGFIFDYNGWDGVMMVNTTGEVAVFGYVLPFYAFLTPYVPGSYLDIGITYFNDPNDGKNKIQYRAGAETSPVFEFGNAEGGIIDGTSIGGYGQFQVAPGVDSNYGQAEWVNIQVVPEPGSLMVLGAGVAGLLFRRRR